MCGWPTGIREDVERAGAQKHWVCWAAQETMSVQVRKNTESAGLRRSTGRAGANAGLCLPPVLSGLACACRQVGACGLPQCRLRGGAEGQSWLPLRLGFVCHMIVTKPSMWASAASMQAWPWQTPHHIPL